jgi:tRNA pseudouridine38-40 synthase
MRIALGLEYNGAAYQGWQSQPGGRTVQDTVEAAVREIAGESVRVICAGRTDTGVHALGQVVHFDTAAERPDGAWVKGVNTHLPSDIAVRWSARVSDGFHARFSAGQRRYDYYLINRPVRPAVHAGTVGWFHLPLDVERMRDAARVLIGEHDFSAFRSAECQAKSPVRTLTRLDITRSGDLIQFTLEANAFLHHMVRNIIGCLVYIGKGKHAEAWLGEVLAGRNRALAAPTFSPAGLYLSQVDYAVHWGLPGLSVTPEASMAIAGVSV